MVYEANARIRDPVYGCAGVIFQLQKQVTNLQGELAKAQAERENINIKSDKLQVVLSLFSGVSSFPCGCTLCQANLAVHKSSSRFSHTLSILCDMEHVRIGSTVS